MTNGPESGVKPQELKQTVPDCAGVCPDDTSAFPQFSEQFHRIGKGGGRYWGKRGAGVVFCDGHRILLLKRKSPSDHAGTWGIPGGKAEDGESPIDTARREIREECGKPLTGQQLARFDNKDGAHSFVVFLYRVQPFSCNLSNEHSDFEWFELAKLNKVPLHPKLKEALPRYEKAIERHFSRGKSFAEWLSGTERAGE